MNPDIIVRIAAAALFIAVLGVLEFRRKRAARGSAE
jgi:hypothetical protein